MEYTKGDWKAKKNALGTWTISTDFEHIGQIDSHFNAQLIAAAPELYEACKALVSSPVPGTKAKQMGRQALAKVAEGK